MKMVVMLEMEEAQIHGRHEYNSVVKTFNPLRSEVEILTPRFVVLRKESTESK